MKFFARNQIRNSVSQETKAQNSKALEKQSVVYAKQSVVYTSKTITTEFKRV